MVSANSSRSPTVISAETTVQTCAVPPEPQINLSAWVLCTSWCVLFGVDGAGKENASAPAAQRPLRDRPRQQPRPSPRGLPRVGPPSLQPFHLQWPFLPVNPAAALRTGVGRLGGRSRRRWRRVLPARRLEKPRCSLIIARAEQGYGRKERRERRSKRERGRHRKEGDKRDGGEKKHSSRTREEGRGSTGH